MSQSRLSQTILRSSRRLASASKPLSTPPFSPVSKPGTLGMATASIDASEDTQSKKWATYSLPRKAAKPFPAFSPMESVSVPFKLDKAAKPFSAPSKPITTPVTPVTTAEPAKKPRRKLRPRKAAITLSSTAVKHLEALLAQPNPQMIRIGVRNRGCSGLTYHLEYVDQPQQFDEEIVQDGVKVLIDSKALFSIIGSEMDWVDDKLSTRFVFNNPNVKGECGCGESFMV